MENAQNLEAKLRATQEHLWREIDRYHRETGISWFKIAVAITVHPMTMEDWRKMKYIGKTSIQKVVDWIDAIRAEAEEEKKDDKN